MTKALSGTMSGQCARRDVRWIRYAKLEWRTLTQNGSCVLNPGGHRMGSTGRLSDWSSWSEQPGVPADCWSEGLNVVEGRVAGSSSGWLKWGTECCAGVGSLQSGKSETGHCCGSAPSENKRSLLAALAQEEPEMWEHRPLGTVAPTVWKEKHTPGSIGALAGHRSEHETLRKELWEMLERSHSRKYRAN
jgi:hypothetical protein